MDLSHMEPIDVARIKVDLFRAMHIPGTTVPANIADRTNDVFNILFKSEGPRRKPARKRTTREK